MCLLTFTWILNFDWTLETVGYRASSGDCHCDFMAIDAKNNIHINI